MNFYTYAKHYGNKIHVRGVRNGKRFNARHDFSPTLYVRSEKPSDYKSMFGEKISPIVFDTNKEATEFVDRYKDVSNFPIFGQTQWGYQYLTEQYPGEVQWSAEHIGIYSIDIETSSENGFPQVDNPVEEVLLITLQNNFTKDITTFGVGSFTPTVHTEHLNVNYIQCDTERALLFKFMDWWKENCPDVITGWNSSLFDIPYLVARTDRLLGDDHKKMYSPFGLVSRRVINIQGREQTTYDVQGVAQLDYLDLYKKFTYTAQESYKLDYIAEVELGHKKLDNPYDTFKEFYENDWNLFVEYNIIDTVLVDELEDKMKLIELCLTMAYDAKCNYQDVFSSVRTWDCLLYNHLIDQHVVIHQKPSRPARTIAGAFVQEPVPGQYEWVASFDATSLYPSIIMQYNMSPETLVPGQTYDVTVDSLLNKTNDLSELHKEDYAMTANGYCFTRTRMGYFPEIVSKFFDDRQKYKRLMINAQNKYEETGDKKYLKDISKFNNFQMARKIQLNSLYGAMANEYFRYYDDRIAEGITLTGQYIIRQTATALDKFINKICDTENEMYSFYSDTDSCYITLKPLVDKFFANKSKDKVIDILDKVGTEQIEPCIDKAMRSLANYTNAFEHKLFFKREAIADKCIWVAKKRYAMNVYDNEGVRYKEPKLKVMGLEIVRSSTPGCVRNSLKEAVRISLTQDENSLHKFIEETKAEFKNKSPEEIAFPRGCNNLAKYRSVSHIYEKGTPMHVRGSLLYNYYLKENKVAHKYEDIKEGDKIKFIYLKEPNIVKENVMAFIGTLPVEFGVHKYIDYDMMFQKAFIEPMDTIIKSLGWNTEPQATLEDLFS